MKKRGIIVISLYLLVFIVIEISMWIYNDNLFVEVQKDDNKIKLQLIGANGDLTWLSVIENTISEFEKANPNIEVELRFDKSNGLYEEYTRRLAATGNLGDIIEIKQMDFFRYGYMSELPSSLTENMKNIYVNNRKVYGVNYHITTTGIIYNKEIFTSLGLHEPKTYAEFMNICKVIKENGYTPLAVGGGDEWHMKSWLNHFYINDILINNLNWEEDLKVGKVSWLDEEPKKMFTHIYDLFNSGYVDKDWRTDKDSLMATKIANGDAAMLYSGTWMFNQIINENPNIELGWFFVPNDSGQTLIREISDVYWGITNECAEDNDKYEAAIKFLEFYFSEPIYSENYNKMGAISNKVNSKSESKVGIQKEVEDEFNENQNHTKLSLGDENFTSSFQKVVLTAELLMLNDEITIDEALELCNEGYLSSMLGKE